MKLFKMAKGLMTANLLNLLLADCATLVNSQSSSGDKIDVMLEDPLPEKYGSGPVVTSDTGVSAPTSGNFFYVEFNSGGVEGDYYIQFSIGSTHQTIKAWVTTEEHDIGIITTQCDNCMASSKFNMASSSTFMTDNIPEFEGLVLY